MAWQHKLSGDERCGSSENRWLRTGYLHPELDEAAMHRAAAALIVGLAED